MSSIHDVRQFHSKFGFTPNRDPNFLVGNEMAERLNFLLEELLEFATACGYALDDGKNGGAFFKFVRAESPRPDLEMALDGLVDLVYVALGTADKMGFSSEIPPGIRSKFATIWWEAWHRVHVANMAKRRVTDLSQSKRHTLNDTYKPVGWMAPTFKDLLKLR